MPITKEELKIYKKVQKRLDEIGELICEERDDIYGYTDEVTSKEIFIDTSYEGTIEYPLEYLFQTNTQIRKAEKLIRDENKQEENNQSVEDAKRGYIYHKLHVAENEAILREYNIDPTTL